MIGLDLIVGVLIACVATLAVLALARGVRMIREADTELDDGELSGELGERVKAWRQHVDEAMHLANSDTCVMCDFDRARAPREKD